MTYNYVFVSFNSMSNLIVFCQFFPCMFVGFNVRIECESLVKNCEDNEIRDLLAIDSRVDKLQKVT